MNTENQFKHGQEVWLKVIVDNPKLDCDGDIGVIRRYQGGDKILTFASASDICTTEQICAEVIKEEEERLKNIGIEPPCDGQNAGREAPQNANLTEPDRNRRFKKGDKVRIVERWGRTPWLNCSNLELGETYTVYADEEVEDEEIYLEAYDNSEGISPFFLDLVKPATEPKYWVKESTLCYYINYKGADDCIYTALYMNKDLYTLEEAQEQCDKLNRKEQEND